jgi:DNA-directed RNA polymerase specialized sigma subunit
VTLRTLIDCFPPGVDTISVQAIHAGYGDCAQSTAVDEPRWLFSKTAAEDIGVASDRGIVLIDSSAPIFTATVDRSLVSMLETASGEKTAAAVDADEVLALTESLVKYAAESDQGDPSAIAAEPQDGPDDATLARAWQGGDKVALSALLKRHDHIIKRHAARFHGADLPPAAVDAEAKQVAMEAFKNYDPNRGVRLSTYMTSYMPKIRRYVIKHQNPVRVSEDAALRIRSYHEAVDELTQKNGTAPTAGEIADHRKWSIRDVKKTKLAIGGARISELDEETPVLDDGTRRTDIFIDYLYHELQPKEQKVLEHLYGLYGTPKIEKTEDIAKATGYSPAQTYRIRNNISAKIQEHVDKV